MESTKYQVPSTKAKSGFTLVETTIYLALFALIMTGALTGTYSLLESAGRNQVKAMAQEEGNYLIGKIDWALTGVKINSDGTSAILNPTVIPPAIENSGTVLSLTKSGGVVITIDTANGDLRIDYGSGVHILNNSNVKIGELLFTHTRGSGDGISPESVEARFTLYATTSEGLPFTQGFSTVKYLRK